MVTCTVTICCDKINCNYKGGNEMKKILITVIILVTLAGCSGTTKMSDAQVVEQVLENYQFNSTLNGRSDALWGLQNSGGQLNSTKFKIENGQVTGVSITIGEMSDKTESPISFNIGENYDIPQYAKFEIYSFINLPLAIDLVDYEIVEVDDTTSMIKYSSEVSEELESKYVSSFNYVEIQYDHKTFEILTVSIEQRKINSTAGEVPNETFTRYINTEFVSINDTKPFGEFFNSFDYNSKVGGKYEYLVTRVELTK